MVVTWHDLAELDGGDVARDARFRARDGHVRPRLVPPSAGATHTEFKAVAPMSSRGGLVLA